MAQKLDPADLAEFKELLMANSIQTIEKDIITSDEFFGKLKQVQKDYQSRKNNLRD